MNVSLGINALVNAYSCEYVRVSVSRWTPRYTHTCVNTSMSVTGVNTCACYVHLHVLAKHAHTCRPVYTVHTACVQVCGQYVGVAVCLAHLPELTCLPVASPVCPESFCFKPPSPLQNKAQTLTPFSYRTLGGPLGASVSPSVKQSSYERHLFHKAPGKINGLGT